MTQTTTRPTEYAMVKAGEEIGADVLVRLNQRQLAKSFDRVLAPVREFLLSELRKIDEDERFHYPCANVVINAPLALEQLAMETRASQAIRLLRVLGYDGPEMSIKAGPKGKAEAPR